MNAKANNTLITNHTDTFWSFIKKYLNRIPLKILTKISFILNDLKIIRKCYERKIKTTKCEEMVWNITEHSSAYRVLSEKS